MLARRAWSVLAVVAVHSAILGLAALLGGTNGFLAAFFVVLVIEARLVRLRCVQPPRPTPSRGADSPPAVEHRSAASLPATALAAARVPAPTAEAQKEESTMTIRHRYCELCVSDSSELVDDVAVDDQVRRATPTTSQPASAATMANR